MDLELTGPRGRVTCLSYKPDDLNHVEVKGRELATQSFPMWPSHVCPVAGAVSAEARRAPVKDCNLRGWGNGSVLTVVTALQRTQFNSTNPCGGSQQSRTLVPGYQTVRIQAFALVCLCGPDRTFFRFKRALPSSSFSLFSISLTLLLSRSLSPLSLSVCVSLSLSLFCCTCPQKTLSPSPFSSHFPPIKKLSTWALSHGVFYKPIFFNYNTDAVFWPLQALCVTNVIRRYTSALIHIKNKISKKIAVW